MTQYYSRTDTVYSGSAVISIPFSYISKDDISVIILRDDEEIAATFTWQNASQINITTELQTGDVISVRRHTPIDEKIVTYTDESMILDDNNLNLSQDQLLDAVQEIWDNGLDVTAISSEAITKADTALATANSADSKADNAVSTANTASSNASTALSNSQTALSNSQTAVSTANSASGAATYASNKVDEFGEDIEAVIAAAEEIEALEEAVITATNAADTATNAAETATTAAQALQNIKTVNSTSLLGGGNVEVADLSLSNLNATGQGILNNKADIDLSNLSSTGQGILDNKLNRQQVTNCIIESPQRVKYTFVDGALIIKAGSVIIIPYGTTDLSSTYPVGTTFINNNLKVYDTYWDSTNSKFYVYAQLQEDHIRAASAGSSTITTRHIAFSIADNSLGTIAYGNAISSTSDTVSPSTCLFYNTTSNLVKKKDSGVIGTQVCSLPFGLVVNNDTYQVAKVKQIFNGFGYIGSVIWADKGIKGLIPNGRNNDGNLNNTEFTTSGVLTIDVSVAPDGLFNCGLNANSITRRTPRYCAYYPESNFVIDNGTVIDETVFGNFKVVSGVITVASFVNALNINSMCDGQWVNKLLEIANGVAAPASTDLEYSLSSYLPNDNYNYEVLFRGTGVTGSTSGNRNYFTVTSDIIPYYSLIASTITRSAGALQAGSTVILPVGTARTVTILHSSNNTGTVSLYALGYRRIGTNS
jgi:hypothetical protein